MRLETLHTEHLFAGKLRLTLNWHADSIVEIGLGWDDGTVTHATTPQSDLSACGRATQAALEQYAAGKPTRWPDMPLALHLCTPFTREVLTQLCTVPAGSTVTYKQLAAMAGRPNAARGVGQIMRRNRWPLIVPCHRVLGSTGAMVGFANPSGIPLKEYLLQLERGAA